jgi:hypothetical protein
MARGSENQPEKHADSIGDCKIVFYEQDSHRGVSKANALGFCGGEAGPDWQSHHLVCIMALANRETSSPEHAEYLQQCLWMTDWNINKAPNMIGLPTRSWYRKAYDNQNFAPQNLPSHNNDHPEFLQEVHEHLGPNVWDTIDPDEKDHKKGAEQLKEALEKASKHFQKELLKRGIRNSGTMISWKTRFNNNTDKAARRASMGANNLWYQPFSMALLPKPRNPGQTLKDLAWLFSSDSWK